MERRKAPAEPFLPVPSSLEIEDGYLVWDERAPEYSAPRPMMLEDFLLIKTDQAILDFARKFGTMGMCEEHVCPGCNEPLPGGQFCRPTQAYLRGGLVAKEYVWREPLWAWQRLVNHANAMRRIGTSIQSGGNGTKFDWEIIIIPEDRSIEQHSRQTAKIITDAGMDHIGQPWKSARSAQQRFSWIMQKWLDVGNVRPSFEWGDNRWAIRSCVPTRVWPLFGHLALYLAVAITGGMESAICTFCGREYFPQRRPSSGQRNCCGADDCKRNYWREHKRARSSSDR